MSNELKFEEVYQDPGPETGTQAPGQSPQDKPKEQPQEPPKRKRGRPRKEDQQKQFSQEKTQPKKEASKQLDIEEELSKLTSYKEAASPGVEAKDPQEAQEYETLISGKLLLLIADAIIPLVLTKVFRKPASKRKEMRLTAEERKDLEPVADAAAKEVIKNMPPLQQFFIALTAVYASKL